MTLIISYSGIRGIVGASLTEPVVERFARAFGRLVTASHPRILLARDTRPSGLALCAAAARGLAPFGELIDLGVVPTPTLQVAMDALSADAGLCITASHNPSMWNGLKFFMGPDNIVLDGEQIAALSALAAEDDSEATDAPTLTEKHDDAVRAHIARVLAHVDRSAVAARGFRVALDPGGGAGAEPTRMLLEELGCEVVMVQTTRESEPIAEHLGDLCRAVVDGRCDLGLAQDLDADRLALVDELGHAPGEESTLVLAVEHLLQRFADQPRVVVKNAATTRAVDDVASAHGATVIETRVGEVNLSRALIEQTRRGVAAFGGEGNGGVIFPPVAFGRDSLSGAAIVLEHLARDGRSLSQRIAALPRYHIRKAGFPCPADIAFEATLQRAAALFPDGRATHQDGLKLELPDGSWFALRKSNTEPIVRIVAESPSEDWPNRALEILAALL